MDIKEVTKEEYSQFVINPFSGFDKADFCELNKEKVNNNVKYFIFENNKKRFGLLGGIKGNVLKFPFSASFSIISEIAHNNKIEHYHQAIEKLIEWAKENSIEKIIFNTPPIFFNESHITKFQNALFCNGFKIVGYDINFQYQLKNYINEQNYINSLLSDSRRNLKQAYKNNLKFEKTDNLEKVYEIIKTNRQEKGFPLYMNKDDILNTSNFIKSDYFLVSNDVEYIASAYIQHITKSIVNVVYWGNLQKSDKQYPMNFIAQKVFNYYSNEKGIDFVSIGTSTLDSKPNFGLCNFKESIGCACSPKLLYEIEL